jgi:hypothetical protein
MSKTIPDAKPSALPSSSSSSLRAGAKVYLVVTRYLLIGLFSFDDTAKGSSSASSIFGKWFNNALLIIAFRVTPPL